MLQSLVIDFYLCSIKQLSFGRAIKLNSKPCPHSANPSYQGCPATQPVLDNKAMMRCQLGFHERVRQGWFCFSQRSQLYFLRLCSGLEGALAGDSPLPLKGHARKSCLSNQESQPRWVFVGQPRETSAFLRTVQVTEVYSFTCSMN